MLYPFELRAPCGADIPILHRGNISMFTRNHPGCAYSPSISQ
jgi:hypothetical protein